MHKLNERGSLLIPLIITGSLLFFSLIFAFWAFAGRQEYKNDVDGKIAEAVEAAEDQLSIEKEQEFAELQKSPYETYTGPSAFGTLSITYPKTWSVYLNDSSSTQPVKGYMHPDIVTAEKQGSIFAFRFEVVNQNFDAVAKTFDGKVKSQDVTYTVYRIPKQQSVAGARIVGIIEDKTQGEMVILPLRDKTIKIWTEGSDYRKDFEAILQEFNFVP